MQYYFSKSSYKSLNTNLSKSKLIIFSLLITFVLIPSFAWANPVFSPLDTTLVIEKDIYPKVVNRQERLIEGKKYVFATINERKGMVALSGNFLSEMARAAGIEVADFLYWNDMNPTDAIKTGQVYYLQEKGNRAKDIATHVLMNNETLWDVSQKYAMRYKYVLKYNRLDEDDKVKTGRVLWIQTKRPKRIPVEVRDITPIVASFEEETEDETAADPELMAEWEELKKTELAGINNNENDQTESTNQSITTTTKTEDNQTTTASNSEQGSFAEFDNTTSETTGVIITEKAKPKKETNIASNVVKYHTVAEAESLYDISKKYNVVMSKLKEWNNLADYTTYTGQKIIVSQPNSSNEDKVYDGSLVTEKKKTSTSSSDKKVVVKQNGNGEFVTFVDSSGILLPVPQQDFTPIAPTLSDKNYHIVKKDETLYSIARDYNLNPLDVIRWNGFIKGDNIDVGDKIILNSSLALPVGSRDETIKNNSTSSSVNTSTTATSSEFKEPALIDPAISNGVNGNTNQSQTNASTISMEEFIKMGGEAKDFVNLGKEGYGELGELLPEYASNTKSDTTKTKTEETQTKVETYVVQPKDMLGKIAQSHNITTKEMMAWNPKIPANGTIYKGDTLFVSKPKSTITEETEKVATVYPIEYYGAGFHAVQPTQTVYHLSEKYGIPVANIRKWNNLSEDIIDLPVGEKMIINEGVLKMANNNQDTSKKVESQTNEITTKVNYSYHSVEKGETLFSIAQKYNLSTAQVREWNSRQGDLVYEGEKLIIGIK
ncbi:LysM repeat-containing protein [Bernardetia litoralis DSM 6794]|uniref:LysM repeat-containing protein n=1 Tax=Bernardetia litoralis (strain ATCC 23117 / DSM 6794 / NBRC 15988 / NCIMB 1366 / Fx l1 / Sio-4) TaxID=880071 RepID=I4AQM0_BERLS|nr:LysM peptidoglycan-binding domain-containing protein [Bernardetia litoralis]AFM06255.1 LysM repeat-containing protein [Bernardetia litoralis DSM 6794]